MQLESSRSIDDSLLPCLHLALGFYNQLNTSPRLDDQVLLCLVSCCVDEPTEYLIQLHFDSLNFFLSGLYCRPLLTIAHVLCRGDTSQLLVLLSRGSDLCWNGDECL